MACKRLLIDDILTVMVFPENPKFNQWMNANYAREQVPAWFSRIQGEHWLNPVTGFLKPHAKLINWADDETRMNFHIYSHPSSCHFVETVEFRYLKERFDSITVRGKDHLIFNDPHDIVMFRLMYGDSITNHE